MRQDDDITLRDIAPGDAGWLIQRHAELYARDEGFDWTFEPLVAEILVDFLRNRGPNDRAFIAVRGDVRLGSVFCVRLDAETAKLRLFLLESAARGKGFGQRLLDACLNHARSRGFRRITLWTHESHHAACALYHRNGFDLVSARSVTSFGVNLVEQTWSKDLLA
jgi:GNAT superfamily N-acetyltransferase